MAKTYKQIRQAVDQIYHELNLLGNFQAESSVQAYTTDVIMELGQDAIKDRVVQILQDHDITTLTDLKEAYQYSSSREEDSNGQAEEKEKKVLN